MTVQSKFGFLSLFLLFWACEEAISWQLLFYLWSSWVAKKLTHSLLSQKLMRHCGQDVPPSPWSLFAISFRVFSLYANESWAFRTKTLFRFSIPSPSSSKSALIKSLTRPCTWLTAKKCSWIEDVLELPRVGENKFIAEDIFQGLL